MTDQPPTYAVAPTWPGQPAYAPPQSWPLASWGSRVGASIIDSLLSMIGLVPYFAGFGLLFAGAPKPPANDAAYLPPDSPATGNGGLVIAGGVLLLVGLGLMVGIQLWNRVFRQGRTGQSVGKKAMGLALVSERTSRPIGPWMSFVRDLAHFLDGIFYIGYLWPLWDPKRQTFADKVMETVVIHAPRG
ncbi:RDD family protein [Pedococcus sp.]|uniref:RDD family protein n=1 Tax=Pedococcus sp. TaxID=2860345 RepID=UPI002E1439AD|nr:RDD family protein [Pedococcus sp.]